jgi:hypothetical protein
MPHKDPEKRKQYRREYRKKNKEKLNKQDKEYYYKKYRKTESCRKSHRIARWKQQGILCFDYDLLNELYLKTTHCEFCNCELNKCPKSRKCLDHDHTITDRFNVRGVLCNSCNAKDVLK